MAQITIQKNSGPKSKAKSVALEILAADAPCEMLLFEFPDGASYTIHTDQLLQAIAEEKGGAKPAAPQPGNDGGQFVLQRGIMPGRRR